MSLPTAITENSLYVVGVNELGQPEATVFCSIPYPACPECGTMHAIMVVSQDQSYRCCWCAGRLHS